jgi:hypothetical protein
MMRRSSLLFLLVCACGDDADEPPDPLDMDAGMPPRVDAFVPLLDAALESLDAASDSGEPLPAYAECRGSLHSLHAANTAGQGFSSAVTLNQIYVAYTVATCGGSPSEHAAEGLVLVRLPTRGAAGEPEPLINAGASDCVRTSVPTLQGSRGALQVYYASNQGGSPQVYLRSDAGTQQLSSGSGPLPVDMAVDDARIYYARGNAIYAQEPGSLAQPIVASDEGYTLERIAVSKLGPSLGMVAWTSAAESVQGVFLRVLDPEGTTPSSAQRVGAVGPGSALALSTQSKRGAVVYSDELGAMYLRTVELDHSLGEPVRLTSGNQFVSDLAMARYGIGYAIAYRATPMTSGQAVLRLLMVDELGNAAKPRVISEARSDGRGLEVHVANDGRVVIVWADPGEGETLIRIARVSCL